MELAPLDSGAGKCGKQSAVLSLHLGLPQTTALRKWMEAGNESKHEGGHRC